MPLAKVEADSGEVLNIRYPDGRLGGNLILSFITALDVHCSERVANSSLSPLDDLNRFSELEALAGESLCTINSVLNTSTYSGDWNYSEDEYEFFLKRVQDYPVTEQGFKTSLRHAEQAWTDIEPVMKTADSVINLLKAANLEEQSWYVPELTTMDFQALYDTLEILNQRGAERVRINIE
jgi:hypothetical protein